jgi:VIT1/CCC1 family predicted Fe2+/Mn2+ transporter
MQWPMPQTPHVEKHFNATETVRDIVIGMSDGLTVPFALAAGLSGAVDNTTVIVVAGIAEIAAGSIAMGLGGYLAARTDAEHYDTEYKREEREIKELEHREVEETREILGGYGLSSEQLDAVIAHFRSQPRQWIDFMMRFELGLEKPLPKRAFISAGTIGGAYIVGGMIPLLPYIIWHSVQAALPVSVVVTLLALAVFGSIKARVTGTAVLRGAWQTLLVGGLAAGVAFGIAKLIG